MTAHVRLNMNGHRESVTFIGAKSIRYHSFVGVEMPHEVVVIDTNNWEHHFPIDNVEEWWTDKVIDPIPGGGQHD